MEVEIETLDSKEKDDIGVVEGITLLNDYCLQNIFRKLTPIESVRVELVCKTWQQQSLNSWSRLKDIDFDPLKLGFKSEGKLYAIRYISHEMAREILKRCGKYIHRVDFKEKQGFCIMDAISKFCPNVQCIENAVAAAEGLRCMANDGNCRNLIKLHIRALIPERTEWDLLFGTIFDNNKNLQFLKIGNGNALNGDCLEHLPLDKLKELSIQIPYSNAARFIDRLVWVSMAATNLTSLCVGVKNGNEAIINSLSNADFEKMTELHLSCLSYMTNLEDHLCRIFKRSKNLIRLKLYISCVNDITGACFLNLNRRIEVLEADTYRCCIEDNLFLCLEMFKQLTTLSIDIMRENWVCRIIHSLHDCSHLQNLSLNLAVFTSCNLAEEIGGLKQLKYFKITSMNISDVIDEHFFKCISTITGLKSLAISGFEELSASGFRYLTNLIQLKELYISDIIMSDGCDLSALDLIEKVTIIDCASFNGNSILGFLKFAFNLKYGKFRGIDRSIRKKMIISAVGLVNSVEYTQDYLFFDMELDNLDNLPLKQECNKLRLTDSDPRFWSSP